jgi:hypothetical protein
MLRRWPAAAERRFIHLSPNANEAVTRRVKSGVQGPSADGRGVDAPRACQDWVEGELIGGTAMASAERSGRSCGSPQLVCN